MTLRINTKKWILYRHIKNFKLLCVVAEFLKFFSKTSISKEEKAKLNLKLKEAGLYRERNINMPLDAINHKINQLSFYMFGYQTKIDGVDRFLFSPLGNLFLKHVNNKEKVSKIFLTMLWSIQYQHPHSGTNKDFQLYPFRLIFKLLCEEKLHNKLYAYEIAYLLVFVKNININSYKNLVKKILNLRGLTNEQLAKKFKNNEHVYVNSAYEWDYYVSNLLQEAGVLRKTKGDLICKLQHGSTTTFRKITSNIVEIPNSLKFLVNALETKYSFMQKPLLLNDKERLKIDVVKEIYSFYPKELLDSIDEPKNEIKFKLLNLAKLIEEYSNNKDGKTAYLFEDILTDGFNMFYNVEARKIGGAGNTDIECLYINKKKKFAVDAKSTKNKLLGINAGRLMAHKDKIGGEYVIVITPRYVPAVLQDIKSSQIVIISASTFSEYLYNNIENDIRQIDFKDFDAVITKNLGNDISAIISNMTIEKFATIAK